MERVKVAKGCFLALLSRQQQKGRAEISPRPGWNSRFATSSQNYNLRHYGPCETIPVPLTYTVCGVLLALSLTTIFADSKLLMLGVNLTVRVQLAPAAKPPLVFGQLSVSAKSPGFVPPTEMLETVSALV